MERVKKKPEILEAVIHILFWIIFIIGPTIISRRPVPFPNNGAPPVEAPQIFYNPLLSLIPLLIIYFYLNYLIYSRWYRQHKYLRYSLWNTGTILAIFILRIALDWWVSGSIIHNLFFDFILFLFFFLLSTSITIIKTNLTTTKQLKESEISFLRNQINPHFIFNVMNMIVVFSRKYPEKVESALNTLSDILRYMIYDNKERNKVSHEIMVIEQYLSLQRLRFGDEVHINTSFIEEDKSIMIEPMLLIPIIENAFKHGTSMISSPVIDISILSEDGILYLNIKNKFSPNTSSSLTSYSGLGLANIKRRLELLYPKKYEFKEEIENGEWFIILLKINCR